jgi:Clr5 domain
LLHDKAFATILTAVMETSVPDAARPDVPFSERWELLKPDLARLYLDENRKLSEIIEIMKSQFGFDAR